jgi:hypothetical protein
MVEALKMAAKIEEPGLIQKLEDRLNARIR